MSVRDNRFKSNEKPVLNSVQLFNQFIKPAVVIDVNDPQNLGRIKVKIPGPTSVGGDSELDVKDIPYAFPIIPRYLLTVPKVGEMVFVMLLDNRSSDRLYIGPVISNFADLFDNNINTSLTSFTFLQSPPRPNYNYLPQTKGIFPNEDDVAIQGRYNTDIILRKNEILIRAGKFQITEANQNNDYYGFKFNTETQGFIQIRNDIPLERKPAAGGFVNKGSITNIIGSKINLLTHRDGNPRFILSNQDDQISNEEILNILETAHPLPFGDLVLQYLKLLKDAFLNHVHNGHGKLPTDLTIQGNQQKLQIFKNAAENLENAMLSKNIRIN